LAQGTGYLLVAVIYITALSWGIGAALLLICIVCTLILVKEKPINAALFHQMHTVNYISPEEESMDDDNYESPHNEESHPNEENPQNEENDENPHNDESFAPVLRSESQTEHSHLFKEVIGEIWWGWKHIPDVILRCMLVHFFAFVGFYCMWIYLADFYGRSIYNGEAHASEHSKEFDLYAKGVSAANYAYMSMSLIGGVSSLALNPLTNRFGVKPVWCACLAIAGAALVSTPIFIGAPVSTAIIVHSFVGLGLCASFSLPWSIVTKYALLYDQSRSGLWTTIFNSSECVAEILVSLVAGNLADAFQHSTAVVMVIGGTALIIGSVLVLRVKEPTPPYHSLQASGHRRKSTRKPGEVAMASLSNGHPDKTQDYGN